MPGLVPGIHVAKADKQGMVVETGPALTVRDMPEWSLHLQLEKGTAPVGDLALCGLRAINDSHYPWLILVPRRASVTEIAELAAADAALLIDEIARVSRVLKAVTGCDKLNLAAIGNVVPQLHVHVVARWRSDPLWPKPIWGDSSLEAGDTATFEKFVVAMRSQLRL